MKKQFLVFLKFFLSDIVLDIIGLCLLALYSFFSRKRDISHIGGMSLAFFAVLFRIVARIQLGDSFAVSIKTKKLITTGLYAKIAHPIYVFSLLALTGVLWSFARPIYFLALLPFLVLEVARARKEKQALLNVYGEKYKQHLKRVRF